MVTVCYTAGWYTFPMGPIESTAEAVRRQLRIQELCETAQQETEFDRLAQIVEEILSLLTGPPPEEASTTGKSPPDPETG